jgi:hypothetical protein
MSHDRLRQLEGRVTRLEEEVRQLKAQIAKERAPKKPWWEEIAGSMQGDKTYAAIVREIRKNRQADYEAVCASLDQAAAGKRPPKQRRTKPMGS